jgi:hypothetical protein
MILPIDKCFIRNETQINKIPYNDIRYNLLLNKPLITQYVNDFTYFSGYHGDVILKINNMISTVISVCILDNKEIYWFYNKYDLAEPTISIDIPNNGTLLESITYKII